MKVNAHAPAWAFTCLVAWCLAIPGKADKVLVRAFLLSIQTGLDWENVFHFNGNAKEKYFIS